MQSSAISFRIVLPWHSLTTNLFWINFWLYATLPSKKQSRVPWLRMGTLAYKVLLPQNYADSKGKKWADCGQLLRKQNVLGWFASRRKLVPRWAEHASIATIGQIRCPKSVNHPNGNNWGAFTIFDSIYLDFNTIVGVPFGSATVKMEFRWFKRDDVAGLARSSQPLCLS